MKTPFITDPILAEMHAIKDSLSEEFNHDVGALCRHLKNLDLPSLSKPSARWIPATSNRKSATVRARATKKMALSS
jgi:hypothetical protein